MNWTEDAFWRCSWCGFLDAWTGHQRFIVGRDPDEPPISRAEAALLDERLAHWQRSGSWGEDAHG